MKLVSILAVIVLLSSSYPPAVSSLNTTPTAMVESWTKTWGGTGSESANHIAIDASGNIYIAGEFEGSVSFDGGLTDPVHNSNGLQDAFLVKLDPSGAFLWAKTWGGTMRDVAYCVAVDSYGNAYVTGPYRKTVDFDPGIGDASRTSNADTKNNIYLSKFASNGSFVWVKTWGPGSQGGAEGYSIAIDASNNLFLVGDYDVGLIGSTFDFNPGGTPANVGSNGFYDGFLARYDASGAFQWVKTWGGAGYDDTTDVVLDGANTVYVTGMYGSKPMNFDPAGSDAGKNHDASENSIINVDVYLTKFNTDGTFQWVRTWGGAGTTEAGHKVLVDHAHNVYLAGRFECTNCNLDGTGQTQDIHATNGSLGDVAGVNDYDAFVSKYDASGAYLWSKTWGGTHWDAGNGIAVDEANNLFVSGIYNDTQCNYSTIPPKCPAVLTSTVDFNPGAGVNAVSSNQNADVYFSKFDPNGNFQWVKTWGAQGSDGADHMVINTNGDIFIAGWYQDTIDFNPGPGFDSHTSSGAKDAFLSKFASIPLPYTAFVPITVR